MGQLIAGYLITITCICCAQSSCIQCKSIKGVRGLSCETLIALTTTIESREWIRCRNPANKLPHEHPRSSTMDNVECFFSLTRNTIGDQKDVQFGLRKLCNEFSKWLDRELSFHYYTSRNGHFFEEERPGFNVYQKQQRNPHH